MDLNRSILYRDFLLNDEDILDNVIPGNLIGGGIEGCVVDSADLSDVDVVQFLEKRSLQDGMDAGDVYLGARRLRMAGTLYAKTRAVLFDQLQALRAALSPTLAMRDEPADKGYQPLYYSVPTNRIVDYPAGAIDLRVLALPRAFQALLQRDNLGGGDEDSLAIPWQATFVLRDPRQMSDVPQDLSLDETVRVNATGVAATNVITATAHGLVDGDRVYFVVLNGGTGITLAFPYFVRDKTTDTFKISLTNGGAAIDFTTDITSGSQFCKVRTDAGTFSNRGDYHAPFNALFVVGATSGTISITVGDGHFNINVPASTGDRTIRYKGEDKVLTIEEDSVETLAMNRITWLDETTHPLIPGGDSPYSITHSGVVFKEGTHVWFWESFA